MMVNATEMEDACGKKKKNNKNRLLFVYVKKKQYLCSDYGLLWANIQKKAKK